jgi:hypothetical protein
MTQVFVGHETTFYCGCAYTGHILDMGLSLGAIRNSLKPGTEKTLQTTGNANEPERLKPSKAIAIHLSGVKSPLIVPQRQPS